MVRVSRLRSELFELKSIKFIPAKNISGPVQCTPHIGQYCCLDLYDWLGTTLGDVIHIIRIQNGRVSEGTVVNVVCRVTSIVSTLN